MPSIPTAVVTGAASGIGLAIARELAHKGLTVLALDQDTVSLAALEREGARNGSRIETHAGDVTERDVLRAAAARATVGRRQLRYWVNNAGISPKGDFAGLGEQLFDQTMAVNMRAVVDGTRIALAVMERAGIGKIVNVASVAGFVPAPFLTSYCASKFAVVGFTRALAAELAVRRSPVRTLLVSPGFVDTPMLRKGEASGFPQRLAFTLSRPEAVARVIVRAMATNTGEVSPTWNGRIAKIMYALFPRAALWASRPFLAGPTSCGESSTGPACSSRSRP